MFNKKIASEIAVGIILLLAIIVGGIFYWQNKKISLINDQPPEQKACSMEAKLCDDGTYVSRTGLNCEFAPCPISSIQQPTDNNQQMANPASVYCEQNGGKNEIQTASDGSQRGMCRFANGNGCEEWAYMRGECKINVNADVSNWKTYTNEKYGFEFKYPRNWNYKIENGEVCFRENGKRYIAEGLDVCGISISETTKSDTQRADINEWSDLLDKDGIKTEAMIIDYHKAIQAKNYGNEITIDAQDENGLEIDIFAPGLVDEKISQGLLDVYNIILSTFKFTK